MPIITVTLIEGYDEDVRERLSQRLTDAACLAIGAKLDGVTVVLNDVPPTNYMRGRIKRVPGAPQSLPGDVVRGFLSAMEARDLKGAKQYLADGFNMTFPGPANFTNLEQVVEWGKGRYRSITKTFEGFDEMSTIIGEQPGAIVYCYGCLQGEWLDGTAFGGIRFIDRFSVVGEKLLDQHVWNDLAEIK
jgi:phenylpyruvate tautomerase PptA (4-oxalocrotonate tautomerase family)